MLTEDGKHLYVSYDEYHNLIEKLALKVHQSGWEFDTILCLARGGMRPGDVLLMTDNAYEPSRVFARGFLADWGVETRWFDPADLESASPRRTWICWSTASPSTSARRHAPAC